MRRHGCERRSDRGRHTEAARSGHAVDHGVRTRHGAFEAQLGLELRRFGSKDVVATSTAMAGANGEIGPFSTTIDGPSTNDPLVLVIFEGDTSGEQTYTKASVVLLGI
jgi:hypothetical protein